jgi:hypothetical protein
MNNTTQSGMRRRSKDKDIYCIVANKKCYEHTHCYNCGAADQLAAIIEALDGLVSIEMLRSLAIHKDIPLY